MNQEILALTEVSEKIKNGKTLLLAGDEKLLAQLPQGDWIGGTIPYFISPQDGGVVSKDKIFVTDISNVTSSIEIKSYNSSQLDKIYTDGGESGFSFIIIPALTEAHSNFALNAPTYNDFGAQPLIGWISGIHLDDLGKESPKVFNGQTGQAADQTAIVMHVCIKEGKTVDVGIVNIFEQSEGDTLTFSDDGFSCKEVEVNGVKKDFASYIEATKLDVKLPLVADYYGALINTSFQDVDTDAGEVKFYAPVYSGVQYKHAKAISDYAAAFTDQLKKQNLSDENVVFSCNCILNFLFSELEGKHTTPFVGPITFGEIAYQLLNQTLVYLEVQDS